MICGICERKTHQAQTRSECDVLTDRDEARAERDAALLQNQEVQKQLNGRDLDLQNLGLSYTRASLKLDAVEAKVKNLEYDKSDIDAKYQQQGAEYDALIEEKKAMERLIEGMKNRLTQIVQSEDTTRMTAEQIQMGYNAHKDLARAALTEMQYPEKRNHVVGPFSDKCPICGVGSADNCIHKDH